MVNAVHRQPCPFHSRLVDSTLGPWLGHTNVSSLDGEHVAMEEGEAEDSSPSSVMIRDTLFEPPAHALHSTRVSDVWRPSTSHTYDNGRPRTSTAWASLFGGEIGMDDVENDGDNDVQVNSGLQHDLQLTDEITVYLGGQLDDDTSEEEDLRDTSERIQQDLSIIRWEIDNLQTWYEEYFQRVAATVLSVLVDEDAVGLNETEEELHQDSLGNPEDSTARYVRRRGELAHILMANLFHERTDEQSSDEEGELAGMEDVASSVSDLRWDTTDDHQPTSPLRSVARPILDVEWDSLANIPFRSFRAPQTFPLTSVDNTVFQSTAGARHMVLNADANYVESIIECEDEALDCDLELGLGHPEPKEDLVMGEGVDANGNKTGIASEVRHACGQQLIVTHLVKPDWIDMSGAYVGR
ncbi:uncharacterized protein SPPG_07659 [Spizellomyces punctatus DAOM BR117]|uniref:Uncharacterized protein n=1 Tax=Spizellomyces punctatus (strain DAOM BR117) TaxID=645134 RepID=A0A0L0H5N8_SPIPD|nr:uncharacterized protein SPPG_07659 [Spizellomyces punctatus DAOM BR117]KNC96825.1 hypothetical protein SPPG_07659 [Spizellomyces punctatus DAOM BR117]|eukprot:XP_016604865.1 hypothetical protein SPPG_07659 [Spizellomyces punctatus DAOM BR117]